MLIDKKMLSRHPTAPVKGSFDKGAVLDAISGQVTFFPFVYVCCWQEVNAEFQPINFRSNSRLIVVSGQLHEQGKIGTHYFTFDGGRFNFLKTSPLGAEGFVVPQ